MNNEKRSIMKRMAIAAVCVGMVGSGGLVQAVNTGKSEKSVVKPLKTGKITSVMTAMINVPASKIREAPLGREDQIEPVKWYDFRIGKAEVTGALWSDVYNWAIKNGYKFANTGDNVGTSKPVTKVSRYDVIVWTNAFSQKSGLQPVYLGQNKKVLKDATDGGALVKVRAMKSSGYRLLEGIEWELAARWLGTTKPTKETLAADAIATKGRDNNTLYYWAPGYYASGAFDSVYNKTETTRVAWFSQKSAKTVCTKASNVLKVCDMSGNVWEWTYAPSPDRGNRSGVRGGSWNYDIQYMPVSLVYSHAPSIIDTNIGFRLARTMN